MPQWQALIISIVVEALVVVSLLWFTSMVRGRRVLFYALTIGAATLMTHPLAWALNRELWTLAFPVRATIIEALVIIAEAAIFVVVMPLKRHQGFLLSACANTMSFLCGLIMLRT